MRFQTKVGAVYVSDRMTGKLKGIESLSTSCMVNPLCKERGKNKACICSHCFARRSIKLYRALGPVLEMNYGTLHRELSKEDANQIRFYSTLGRLESFGDVDSVVQALNYIKIVRANPQTRFAVWTKNPGYWADAFKIERKPRNLSVVYSSPLIDKPSDPSKVQKAFPFVDHVFSVFTRDYMVSHPEVSINCGAKSCATCQRCYKRRKSADAISELMK